MCLWSYRYSIAANSSHVTAWFMHVISCASNRISHALQYYYNYVNVNVVFAIWTVSAMERETSVYDSMEIDKLYGLYCLRLKRTMFTVLLLVNIVFALMYIAVQVATNTTVEVVMTLLYTTISAALIGLSVSLV